MIYNWHDLKSSLALCQPKRLSKRLWSCRRPDSVRWKLLVLSGSSTFSWLSVPATWPLQKHHDGLSVRACLRSICQFLRNYEIATLNIPQPYTAEEIQYWGVLKRKNKMEQNHLITWYKLHLSIFLLSFSPHPGFWHASGKETKFLLSGKSTDGEMTAKPPTWDWVKHLVPWGGTLCTPFYNFTPIKQKTLANLQH